MLYLASTCRPTGASPVVVAARNVHKAFIYAAALLDLEIVWLWPEEEHHSLCGCPISAQGLKTVLAGLSAPPIAVYLTSPDYLGGLADITALSETCHRYGTILAVDNAHGAYLRFLKPSQHPLDLGADICCDSAHKTLPVLTGGAYLHISKHAPVGFCERARSAMALFGSTSPSYLTMASLDRCNRYLTEGYQKRLAETVNRLEALKLRLRNTGWHIESSDPLRLTLRVPNGMTGNSLAETLRQKGVQCEYADENYVVLMVTPENRPEDLACFEAALGTHPLPPKPSASLPLAKAEQVFSIRQALFAPQETIPVTQALGRVCGTPAVSCPPAIPIAVSGERIGSEAIALFQRYGIEMVDVLC